ncbi:MAG: HAD hydrolase family protein [Caldilineaceae bacterium]|nr:HAD hydrolase family protein [Caldilineaceae bacterium]
MTSPHILALDLDDTLLRTDKSIGPVTLAALRHWLAAGHLIVIATGRPPRSIDAVLPDELRCAPRIAYNGAQIIERGEVIYTNPIPREDVRAVLEWTAKHHPEWYVGLEIEDRLFLNRDLQKPGHYEVADLNTLWSEPAAKLLFFFPDGRDDVTPMLNALPPTTRAFVTPKFSMVQLCASTTDKAYALEHFLARKQRALADVIAVGDDVNDIEMVRCSGTGVAVANAVPAVKAVADWMTLSNDEDGVALVIKRLLDQSM